MEIIEILDKKRFSCEECGTKRNDLKYYEILLSSHNKKSYKSKKFVRLCENCVCDLIDHLVEIIPDIGNWYDD